VFEVLDHLRRLLSRDELKQVRGVLFLSSLAGGLQTLAVVSVMPFIALVSDRGPFPGMDLLGKVAAAFSWHTDREVLFGLGLMVFLLVLSANLVASLSLRRVHLTAWNINHFLSQRLLSHYLRQPYSWFLGRHSSELGRNLLEEVRIVVQGALIPMLTAGVRGIEALLLILLLLFVDPFLTLCAGGLIGAAYLLIHFAVRSIQQRLGTIRAEATRVRYQVANEALGGIKEVKSMGAEEAFLRRYRDTGPPFVRSMAWNHILATVPRHLLEVLSLGTAIGIILFLIRSGRPLDDSLPVLALFGFAGYKLVPSFHQVFSGVSAAGFTLPTLRALQEDFATGTTQAPARREITPLRFSDSVGLENVTLRYPGSEAPSLVGVSLRIPKGSRIGVVGPTGAGKTTFVDLLLGLLRPDEGRLVVDGKPIGDGDWEAWRKAVGYVPQSIFLPDDSIAHNIAFGVQADQMDWERIRNAAKAAELDSFINSLPQKYETRVGERGVLLSGGQRQRIGIARALYRRPSLLLLDEATSALDGATESAVMESLFRSEEALTTVIVAHRLSTVQQCDSIVVLNRGRIEGQGSFEELMEGNELFRFIARARS
jgi:ABC-type multidrug transport system fused ATPase/permease subunit